MKKTLKQNNMIIAKADKSKAIVIIDKNKLKHKIDAFIQKNNVTVLNKDPTELYQK
jgi:TusA-related sulfurtransferase